MRATTLIALLASLAPVSQAAVSSKLNEAADAVLAGKTPAQIHSPVLVYHQPVHFEPNTVVARNDNATKSTGGMKLSVPQDGRGASSGSSSQRAPTRETPRTISDVASAPTYGGPTDSRAASMDSGNDRSTNPCSASGYHDNVMAHGLDSARMKCELHALDKNRGQLWGLAGGDPLLHRVMDKQLDQGLSLFGVSK